MVLASTLKCNDDDDTAVHRHTVMDDDRLCGW